MGQDCLEYKMKPLGLYPMGNHIPPGSGVLKSSGTGSKWASFESQVYASPQRYQLDKLLNLCLVVLIFTVGSRVSLLDPVQNKILQANLLEQGLVYNNLNASKWLSLLQSVKTK